MSRGPGTAERFVLERIHGLRWTKHRSGWTCEAAHPPLEQGVGLPLIALANEFAHREGVAYSKQTVESMRRTVHRLEDEGQVSTALEFAPTATFNRHGGHVGKKLLLVGHPDSPNGLSPGQGWSKDHSRTPIFTIVEPPPLNRPLLRDTRHCLVCERKLDQADLDCLDNGVPIGDMCLLCWCERNPDKLGRLNT